MSSELEATAEEESRQQLDETNKKFNKLGDDVQTAEEVEPSDGENTETTE